MQIKNRKFPIKVQHGHVYVWEADAFSSEVKVYWFSLSTDISSTKIPMSRSRLVAHKYSMRVFYLPVN